LTIESAWERTTLATSGHEKNEMTRMIVETGRYGR